MCSFPWRPWVNGPHTKCRQLWRDDLWLKASFPKMLWLRPGKLVCHGGPWNSNSGFQAVQSEWRHFEILSFQKYCDWPFIIRLSGSCFLGVCNHIYCGWAVCTQMGLSGVVEEVAKPVLVRDCSIHPFEVVAKKSCSFYQDVVFRT